MEIPSGKETGRKARAPGAKARPPGGKALIRLHQLELERGFALRRINGDRGTLERGSPFRLFITEQGKEEKTRSMEERAGSRYVDAYRFLHPPMGKARIPRGPVPTGWRPLGPFSIPHGQTYGQGAGSRPSISGRISAVAVDPSDEAHVLIGAAGGGVWETRDGGLTWQPRTDDQPSLATGAIAFDPSNPLTVYAGTGEGDFFGWLGAGLLRSEDGGTTWEVHSPPNTATPSPFIGRGFYDLQVDPLDGRHIFAATDDGLYESTDGSTTWTRRITDETFDISIHPPVPNDPASTDEIFAGCRGGVSRSADGGTTWAGITLPGQPSGFTRIEVCHAPSDGGIVYVFAVGGNKGYLWRRDTFNGSFTAISPPTDLKVGQGWYDWFAAVAPDTPDVIYLGAIDLHKGVRSAGGSWSWTNISSKSTGDSIHPDQHAIAFSPVQPDTIFVGNDGGIYRSTDGGTTFSSLNKGLCITEFEYIAQHPLFEAYLLGGTQDNGSLRYEGSEVWFHIADGDGGDCGLNAGSPYTSYHTYYGLGLERSISGGGWGSWSWIQLPGSANIQSLFYPPLEVQNDIVVQAGQRVFISTDTGTSWNSVDLPAGSGVASALAIAANDRIYVGTQTGKFYRIDLTGGAWQSPVALASPRSGFISDLLVDTSGRIWAAYSSGAHLGHVYRSGDGGASWADVSSGLPDISMNSIEIDPADANRLWVAADVGVWETLDAGATWHPFSSQLPNALAKDLRFHAPSRLLRVATQSRGVWEIPVDEASLPDVEIYLRDSVVDTGRQSPSPTGVPDPFQQGKYTYFWECTDIKVDASPFVRPGLGDVDFEVFEDDHGVSWAGLAHENAQRGRRVRVYVQVHNRGIHAAQQVAVKVFFSDASLGLPNLPSGFWNQFPGNVLPPASPWQAIGAHKVVPVLEPGKGTIVGFEWDVPQTVADHTCLLAIITADNDPITGTVQTIDSLIRDNKKVGLKNLAVVNPPLGPRLRFVLLYIWPPLKPQPHSLKVYESGLMLKRPLVLGCAASKTLSEAARKQGQKRVEFTPALKKEILLLARKMPDIMKRMDLDGFFRPALRTRVLLSSLQFTSRKTPEHILVLLNPEAETGSSSILQLDGENQVVGGFTFEARKPPGR